MGEMNWAKNLEYRAQQLHRPTSVGDVQRLVSERDRIRVLGTGHCFNRIADTEETQVSVRALDEVVAFDREEGRVTIQGGASYGQVCETIDANGFALRNLASLPHISIVGAAATATHGSGAKNQNMATAVSAVEFVAADGALITLSQEEDSEIFDGVPVSLGGLGPVTEVTLDVVPSFDLRQHVYRDLPVSSMRSHFREIMESGYSVSLFTDYRGDRLNQVWRKQKVGQSTEEPLPEFFGAVPCQEKMHPVPGENPEFCTDQFGKPGPWYDRLPHFRMGFTPSSGEEIQSEYFVSREHSVEAYDAIAQLADEIAPHLQISEIRFIDGDELWMSTAHGEPKTAFHFTWEQNCSALRRLLPKIEEALRPYNPRPHWGKAFTMSPGEVRSRYDRIDDFTDLLATYDPEGKFRNDYLRYYLYGSQENGRVELW